MAKLYFYYGIMGSSKTANALITCYNYEKIGKKVILGKPKIENRDGERTTRSRIGLERECEFIEDILQKTPEEFNYIDAIILDEVQFCTKEQIDKLSDLVDFYNIDVLCFGLRTDFQGNLFEGSKRLFEIADCLRETKMICWCGNKAIFNARYNENGIIKDGEQIDIGADNKYISLCRKHYKKGKLSSSTINEL